LRPAKFVESGSWQGWSLWLARKTLEEDAALFSLDPMDAREYRDPLATYFTGRSFVDFLSVVTEFGEIGYRDLAFFDDHQDVIPRLTKAQSLGFSFALLNDNYPIGAGSHRTLSHAIERGEVPQGLIDSTYQFPNIVKGTKRQSQVEYLFEDPEFLLTAPRRKCLLEQSERYRWNTFVHLLPTRK
jgi:hypothetical protein